LQFSHFSFCFLPHWPEYPNVQSISQYKNHVLHPA
jgi:hypothetical protein